MNNIRPMPSTQELYDEASLWIVKMDKGLSADEQTALQEWMQADQAHYDILMEMTQLWDKMDAMSRLSDLFVKPKPAAPQWPLVSALAASVLFAVSVAIWAIIGGNSPEFGDNIYRTAIGEQSTVILSDGSQITLNTNTKVQVKYTARARLLQLSNGELHVRVAKDPARPLSVMVGDQVVQAVGTEFNIEITDQQKIELVVTEGKVKVNVRRDPQKTLAQADDQQPDLTLPENAVTVAAGEQVVLSDKGVEVTPDEITEVSADDIKVKLSWRQGNLIFRGESLEEAVKEIGRYTSVEFVFMNEDLKKMRVAGLFKAGDVEGLLATLRENFDIVSQKDGNGKVLLSAD